MTSIPSDKTTDSHAQMIRPPHNTSPHRVAFLILPGVQVLDLAGPAQVFYTANRLGAQYNLTFCAASERVVSAQGLVFAEMSPLPELSSSDSVIIPGVTSEAGVLTRPLLNAPTRIWLQSAFHAGVSLASVCTGAFALGEAGLLNGRRCTTHWLEVAYLQACYPSARVVDNVLFVRDQLITTSAGIASGIDMALWMVEQEYGALFTAQVARCLVVYLRRNGAQSQTSVYMEYRTHLDSNVHQAQDFILNHLAERLTMAGIAQAAHLSTRTLSRAFKAATGLTPVQYHQTLRLALAETLMSNSQFSIDAIAEKCGFEDGRHFRRLWKARYGSAPSTTRENRVADIF